MNNHTMLTLQNKAAPSSRHRVQSRGLWLPTLLVLAGMLVMLYPVVATSINNYGTTKAAEAYAQFDAEVPVETQNLALEEARNYNAGSTPGPILDPWLSTIDDSNPAYSEYLNKLSYNEAMGRLVIPSIDVDLPIYHGNSESTLDKGLGHLFGSDLPVGGEGTHAAITGHTGMPNATMFDNLHQVTEGDVFYVQVAGQKLKYEVDQKKVVLPHETDELRAVPGQDYITLITCTPYGINSHRLLVRAHQVPLDAQEDAILDDVYGSGMQWWMWALIAAVAVVAVVLAVWLIRAAGGRTPGRTNDMNHVARLIERERS